MFSFVTGLANYLSIIILYYDVRARIDVLTSHLRVKGLFCMFLLLGRSNAIECFSLLRGEAFECRPINMGVDS